MWCIWTNVSITRRKSYFIVCDPEGVTRFRHRHFWPCIGFLEAEDIKCYEVRPSETTERGNVHIIVDRER